MPYVVVCYDIVCDRRRNRVMNALREFLPHVQKSVFEGPIDTDQLLHLRQQLQQMVDHAQDTIRIYMLCPRCIPATEIIGLGIYVPEQDADEVI